MNKITVDLGKGTFELRKSARYIGVQLKNQSLKSKLPKILQPKKVIHQWLGGFKIFSVGGGMKAIDAFLNKVRKHKDVAIGSHVYFRQGGKLPIIPTGKIQVTFNPDSTIKDRNKLLKSLKMKVIKKRDQTLWIIAITKDSPNPMKAAGILKKSDLVSHSIPFFDSPVTLHEELDSPLDDLFVQQWYLKNKGGTAKDPKGKFVRNSDIRVPAAWKLLGNRGSSKIKVAIIDNGFDMKHPDFQGKIVHPYSLYNLERQPVQGIGTHGTGCAGLAIAQSNGSGIVGVSPGCKYMPVEGSTHSADTLEMVLKHCIDKGADVISCSWGSIQPEHELSSEHIRVLADAAKNGRNGKGCVILFSVGNENAEFINHYSSHPDVIAVAGSTSADGHFTVSNRGRGISVAAPGGNFALVTTRASWDIGNGQPGNFNYWVDGIQRGTPGLYKHFEGTSASCPLAAGVCALILSANPKLTSREVRDILESTADKIGKKEEYVDGYSLRFGYGRVNAEKAVAEGLFKFSVEVQKNKGWGVQIGVFRKLSSVLRMSHSMKHKFKEEVIIHITKHRRKIAYRIIIGSFSSKTKAQNLLGKIKSEGFEGLVVDLSTFKK